MQITHSLARHERLKNRKQIDSLFAQRNSFCHASIRVFFAISATDKEELKAGFGCSKRHFKSAVLRNRAKRIMREAYRKEKHLLLDASSQEKIQIHLFLLYNNKQLQPYKEIELAMHSIIQKLQKKLYAHE